MTPPKPSPKQWSLLLGKSACVCGTSWILAKSTMTYLIILDATTAEIDYRILRMLSGALWIESGNVFEYFWRLQFDVSQSGRDNRILPNVDTNPPTHIEKLFHRIPITMQSHILSFGGCLLLMLTIPTQERCPAKWTDRSFTSYPRQKVCTLVYHFKEAHVVWLNYWDSFTILQFSGRLGAICWCSCQKQSSSFLATTPLKFKRRSGPGILRDQDS